jgi:hypothetical protein
MVHNSTMSSEFAHGVTSERINIEDLDLDPQNPRLVVGPKPSQADLIETLYESEALDELVTSFIENGYFEEEPLVVVRHGKRFRTVEGNRRLATLKLLHSSSLRKQVGVTDWPALSKEQAARLELIPCVIYPDRDAVLPFLGYRHITGAKKWAPFQKARFVAQLVDSGQRLDEIEDLIGDTTRVVKKLYQEYLVYKQITQDLELPGEPIRARFSLLEVAIGQRAIKNFLGIPRRLPTGKVEAVVPEDHLDELAELTRWIFGDSDHKALIGDSRDINQRLAKVIENEEALSHLRLTWDLEAAYERSGGEEQYLLRRMATAERALRDTAGLLPLYGESVAVSSLLKRLIALVEALHVQSSDH